MTSEWVVVKDGAVVHGPVEWDPIALSAVLADHGCPGVGLASVPLAFVSEEVAVRLLPCVVTVSDSRPQERGAPSFSVAADRVTVTYAVSERPLHNVRGDLIAADRAKANAALALTDWYVVRKADTGDEIPAAVGAHRAAIRAAQNAREEWLETAEAAELDSLLGLPPWPAVMGV